MARKITDEDLANRGVMGLPDVPGLTAIEMQKKLEEIPREVIIPRYNELVDSVADICEEFSKLSTYDVGDYCIYENVLFKCVEPVTVEGDWDSTKWEATSISSEILKANGRIDSCYVNFGDRFNTEKTYVVGDYCIYNDTLYKCTTSIETAGEWDASKWNATSVEKEFVSVNSNLTIDLSNTSLPSETSFSDLIKMMAEKIFEIHNVFIEDGLLKISTATNGILTVTQESGYVKFTGTASGFGYLSYIIDTGSYTQIKITCRSGGSSERYIGYALAINPVFATDNMIAITSTTYSEYTINVPQNTEIVIGYKCSSAGQDISVTRIELV